MKNGQDLLCVFLPWPLCTQKKPDFRSCFAMNETSSIGFSTSGKVFLTNCPISLRLFSPIICSMIKAPTLLKVKTPFP